MIIGGCIGNRNITRCSSLFKPCNVAKWYKKKVSPTCTLSLRFFLLHTTWLCMSLSCNILVLELAHRLENKLQRNFFRMTVHRTIVGTLVLMPLQKTMYPPTLYRLIHFKFCFKKQLSHYGLCGT
jgi:hypothetical protein